MKEFLANEREYDVGWKKLESFICVFYLHLMEALESQDSLQWKKAIDFEFQTLQDNMI
jgi:hypothetical protein